MTTPAPWHLELLGLPAHADVVAVRRAYAAAMRGIDPETDPGGFTRIREAYVAARMYCEQNETPAMDAGESRPASHPDPASLPVGELAPDTQPDDAALSAEASPAVAVDYTITLAWRFAADVGARRPDAIPRLLDDAVAELRTQYIDAPGQFEEYLIDLVGMQRIAQRADVFAAAETRFHWGEVGHLAALGERGRWLELVLAQRETWRAMDQERRRDWLGLLARAEACLDPPTIRRWPEIQQLQERFPAWLSLYVLTETLEAWQHAFDALSPSTRQEYAQRAPGASAYLAESVLKARAITKRRSQKQGIAVFSLALMLGLLSMLFSASQHEATRSPRGALLLPNDTPAQCSGIYAKLNALHDATPAPMPPDEFEALKARGHRCALAGHWHGPVTNPR